MKVLFLLMYYNVGGVETVTHVLANKFVAENHECTLFSFRRSEEEIFPKLDPRVHLYFSSYHNIEKRKIKDQLQSLLKERKIDIVINQSGHLSFPMQLIYRMAKESNAKIISVYHNMPGISDRIYSEKGKFLPVKSLYEYLKNKKNRIFCGLKMRYVYRHSDRYVLLSESFIPLFLRYTMLSAPAEKLKAIPNPLTVPEAHVHVPKSKTVLYVGRMDFNQKRCHRIIEIWERLENLFPDWRMILVGDGPARQLLESMVSTKRLKHVVFTGRQNPHPYYEKASILMLTSEYEGFPLVVNEGCNFGTVPVVYGSFPAVYDIIKNEESGFIIEYKKDNFPYDAFVSVLCRVMSDDQLLSKISSDAYKQAQSFNIDTIYTKWMNLFNDLCQ